MVLDLQKKKKNRFSNNLEKLNDMGKDGMLESKERDWGCTFAKKSSSYMREKFGWNPKVVIKVVRSLSIFQ